MNPLIEQIYYRKCVSDDSGKEYNLHSAISLEEGKFLWNIIRKEKIEQTIETGCNYGLSSLFICDALSIKENPYHIIIDPNQSTGGRNIGINNLEKAGFNFYELIEKPSEFALPNLLEKGENFDFAFIDGWHTFDHALLDFFYLNRLLKKGGIIVFDDCEMPSVNRVLRYISNYPCYTLIGAVPHKLTKKRKIFNCIKFIIQNIIRIIPVLYTQEIFDDSIIRYSTPFISDSSMIALQKTGQDNRNYNWYDHF